MFPTRDIEDRVIHDIMDVLGKSLWSCFWLIYVSFRLNGQLEKKEKRDEKDKSTCMI